MVWRRSFPFGFRPTFRGELLVVGRVYLKKTLTSVTNFWGSANGRRFTKSGDFTKSKLWMAGGGFRIFDCSKYVLRNDDFVWVVVTWTDPYKSYKITWAEMLWKGLTLWIKTRHACFSRNKRTAGCKCRLEQSKKNCFSVWFSLLYWANYNDVSRGHPKWWFNKGTSPKSP